MVKPIIKDSYLYLENCTIADVKRSIKGLEYLNREVDKMVINAYLDFDNRYYRSFEESFIDKIYRETSNKDIEVTLHNNRLFYNNIKLPVVDKFNYVSIYFS